MQVRVIDKYVQMLAPLFKYFRSAKIYKAVDKRIDIGEFCKNSNCIFLAVKVIIQLLYFLQPFARILLPRYNIYYYWSGAT